MDGGGGNLGDGLSQYRHKGIDNQGGVGGRDVGGAEQERAEQALVGDVAPLAAVLAPAVGLVFGQHDQPFGTPSGGSSPDDVVGRGGVVQAHEFTPKYLRGEAWLELGEGEIRREYYHWGSG